MQQLANDFWNLRGTFKVAGLLDVGTQLSVVRRTNGRFLVLDSYTPNETHRQALLGLTAGGTLVDAIINVHPFHTLHCEPLHQLLPAARLIGTRRHLQQAPHLPWDPHVIEDVETQADFADDLDFTVPAGVELVPADDNVHASSVLVRHRRSGIVHVDDTLSVLAAPGALGKWLPQSGLKFHPTLSRALQPRAGAADAFERWALALAERWAGTPFVCAAHSAVRELPADGWRDEVLKALHNVQGKLRRHRRRYG
ncbi:hypothetical protein C1925_02510 [Stenotrophomonas sp. SAU14A_NAIMI4_5]|uniref:hypothetical protein n=1 Tax=Stenotrophomonas sp. SAU14A_NAIMI4_5 TaxID=2072413 RepID=UPI000D541B3E|nr:hypothetical protein [Stenotrophomonas sp. SAU14A_NAIMI4_5]AWH48111.1 hypothetical protein C1925_02510 [Stenotrophomonas sp. SAU14A_NAIMI4_5]